MSFNEVLYKYIVMDDMTPELAARTAMASCTAEELIELMFPLALDRAKRIARNHTRAYEDAVFSGSGTILHATDDGAETVEILNWSDTARRLLSLGFNLPDGRYVTYEDSTARDHRMRATWQRGRANSIVADAQRHEAIAAMMERHDVNRLGDLDVEVWQELVEKHLVPAKR